MSLSRHVPLNGESDQANEFLGPYNGFLKGVVFFGRLRNSARPIFGVLCPPFCQSFDLLENEGALREIIAPYLSKIKDKSTISNKHFGDLGNI